MDVEKILASSGAELPDDVREKLIGGLNSGYTESVAGLKNNNAELLREKQAAATATEEAKVLADQAEAKRLEATGDLEALRKFTDKQNLENTQKLQDTVKQLTDANNARDLATSRAKFGGKFLHSTDADLYLEKMVKIGEDGKATYQDLSGNVVATDSEGFDVWLGSQDSLKHVLKAPASNGGGGNGSDGTPATGKQDTFNALLAKKDKTHAEKLELSRMANEIKQESKEI